jgi:phage terminase Nu1 subunit (DNA packaging protein)
MRVLIIGLAMTLVGCQSQEVSEMSYSQVRDLAIQKNKECAAQGVKPGTEEMKICVSHELNREQALRQNRNARLRAVAASTTTCQGFGNTVTCF